MPDFHAEPYIYLAGLTYKAVLIAWGGFYFRVRGRKKVTSGSRSTTATWNTFTRHGAKQSGRGGGLLATRASRCSTSRGTWPALPTPLPLTTHGLRALSLTPNTRTASS